MIIAKFQNDVSINDLRIDPCSKWLEQGSALGPPGPARQLSARAHSPKTGLSPIGPRAARMTTPGLEWLNKLCFINLVSLKEFKILRWRRSRVFEVQNGQLPIEKTKHFTVLRILICYVKPQNIIFPKINIKRFHMLYLRGLEQGHSLAASFFKQRNVIFYFRGKCSEKNPIWKKISLWILYSFY